MRGESMLFDWECLVGRPKRPFEGASAGIVPDVPDLLAEMQRLGIDRALVRHRACLDAAPVNSAGCCLPRSAAQGKRESWA